MYVTFQVVLSRCHSLLSSEASAEVLAKQIRPNAFFSPGHKRHNDYVMIAGVLGRDTQHMDDTLSELRPGNAFSSSRSSTANHFDAGVIIWSVKPSYDTFGWN